MQQRSPAVTKDVFEKAVGFTKADEFRKAGLYPYFTEFSSGADSGEAEVMMGDRRILMFGSNNYLDSPPIRKSKRPQKRQSICMAPGVPDPGCSMEPWIFTCGSRMLSRVS